MTVTLATSRVGSMVEIVATSDEGSPVWFHWWVDGVYCGQTVGEASPVSIRWFQVGLGEQERIDVVDTTDADADPVALAPDAYPARRTLWFLRSLAVGVDHYRIEQQQDGGEWTAIGRVRAHEHLWDYSLSTGRLDDLADYAWRAVPVDALGNAGTAIAIGSQTIVRSPDAPDWAATFDAVSALMTISE